MGCEADSYRRTAGARDQVFDEAIFCNTHPHDAIFFKARRIVIAHDRSTFDRFVDPIRIHTLTRLATVFQGTESESQRVALSVRENLVVVLAFKLARSGKPGRAKKHENVLLCNAWPCWQSLEQYLLTPRGVVSEWGFGPPCTDKSPGISSTVGG